MFNPSAVKQAIKSKNMKLRKNKRADLENKRKIFLEIGFIITLLMVLAAFEYPSYEKNSIDLKITPIDDYIEDFAPIVKEKQKTPPPPHAIILKPVDNDTKDLIDMINIDVNLGQDESVPVYNPIKDYKKEEIPDDIDYVPFPSKKAVFPGGMSAFYQYLKENLKYPEVAKSLGIKGKVYIEFTIEKDGSITNVHLQRGIGGGCDEEAIRVIKQSPNWIPAKQQERPVRYKMTIPINFMLNS